MGKQIFEGNGKSFKGRNGKMNKKARVIAFYLPQFHPILENDQWWGKGFTEWTNVAKAKPLFRGHYQPKVPADLGFYDLRLPEIREQQVELAREAGVYGFCYWHYWFGNGKRLMANIFDEVLATGKPDFPFCLGWANHSWFAKNWNADGVKCEKLLIEQTYPGIDDYRTHFKMLLEAFKDNRYIKVAGRPLFYIFDAVNLPKEILLLWNEWAAKEGFSQGIYFVAQLNTNQRSFKDDLLKSGFDAVTYQKMGNLYFKNNKFGKAIFRVKGFFNRLFFGKPIFAMDYKKAYPFFVGEEEKQENIIPFMLPQWDHTPRSGKNGTLLLNSTPALFKKHAEQILHIVKSKENKLVFLKSWNEWAEGNYMEPDLKFGKRYITALREALDAIE
jgi:hypothetical protein